MNLFASLAVCLSMLLPISIKPTPYGGLNSDGCSIKVRSFTDGWKENQVKVDWKNFKYDNKVEVFRRGEKNFEVEAVWEQVGANTMRGHIRFLCTKAVKPNFLGLSITIPRSNLTDGSWVADVDKFKAMSAEEVSIPLPGGKEMKVKSGATDKFSVGKIKGDKFEFRFGDGTGYHEYKEGDVTGMDIDLIFPDKIDYTLLKEHTISESEKWIRFDVRRDILEGSALDFSGQGFQQGPAGRYGWLKAVDGRFEFEGLPGVEQRFYGVNLCASATHPTHEVADLLMDRFVRLGYNTIRIHHHDNGWHNEEYRDNLDYLLAAAYKRGIYVTTDLYVSRRPQSGSVSEYKKRILTDEKTYEDWCAFSKSFIEHVNPYTGRAVKDEPGMPLISLVNEGRMIGPTPELSTSERYAYIDSLQMAFYNKASEYVRSLGLKALLTNDNNGPKHALNEGITALYDYVDNHFYVDHPSFFPGVKWGLPCNCGHRNKVAGKGPDFFKKGYGNAKKPYTVSEWTFAAPGHFRSMGGIIVGCMASVQNLDGLWRFAYSHKAENLVDNDSWRMSHFDLNADPISMANDRTAILLFLRKDSVKGDDLNFDVENNTVSVCTERTCGFFSSPGKMSSGTLSAEIKDCPATVCASSMDGKALEESERILFTHLTDAQGDGMSYLFEGSNILMKWGTGTLIEKGRADITLRHSSPKRFSVYELDSTGCRIRKIKSSSTSESICFTATTNGPSGGRIYYEIVKDK